jgi:hypothetical protein
MLSRIKVFIVKISPAFVLYKIVIYFYNLLRKNIGKEKSKVVYSNPQVHEVISTIKGKNNIHDKNDEYSFMASHNTTTNTSINYKPETSGSSGTSGSSDRKIPRININNPNVVEVLRESIIISPYDQYIGYRDDIQLIGTSRITGRNIYRYSGYDFSKFDLPYEEIFFNGSDVISIINDHLRPDINPSMNFY